MQKPVLAHDHQRNSSIRDGPVLAQLPHALQVDRTYPAWCSHPRNSGFYVPRGYRIRPIPVPTPLPSQSAGKRELKAYLRITTTTGLTMDDGPTEDRPPRSSGGGCTDEPNRRPSPHLEDRPPYGTRTWCFASSVLAAATYPLFGRAQS